MKFPFWHTFFSFSRSEKGGLLVLLTILFLITGINMLLPVLVSTPDYDFTAWENEVALYRKRADSLLREKNRLHPVPFNPNRISREELLSMGIPDQPATNWVNYLRKGGRFHQPEDIRKIYGLPDSVCEQLLPYIETGAETFASSKGKMKYPSSRKAALGKMPRKHATVPSRKRVIPVLNLNSTDAVRLEKLPGIGPVLAARIVKYRHLLGGYYSVHQLKEVYGLRDEYYQQALPYLRVDSDSLRRIRINFATVGDLVRHPYISYEEARAVVKRREKEGRLDSFEALNDIFLPEKIEKLQPYIIFAP